MVDAGGDARHAACMPRCFPATLRPDMTTPTLAFRVPAHATRSHHYALRQRAATKHTSLNWTSDNPTADTRPSSSFSRGVHTSRSAQRCRVMHHSITVRPRAPAPAPLCSLTLVQRGRRSIRCMRWHPHCDGAHLWTIRHAWMAPKRRVLLPRPARWFAQPSAPRLSQASALWHCSSLRPRCELRPVDRVFVVALEWYETASHASSIRFKKTRVPTP